MFLESTKNPKIKSTIKLLEKNKERRLQKKIVVEGKQENAFAIKNGYIPIEFFIQPEIYDESILLPKVSIYNVSKNVYEKIAYRKTSEGVVGIYEQPDIEIQDIKLPPNAFVLIIESIEKPGNLGAICRSADAFGADLLIVCDKKTDIFNPNVIRSSVGSIFNTPIISLEKEIAFDLLKNKGVSIFATYMDKKAIDIQNADFTNSCAILFGTEHSGISDFWKDKTVKNILIPMRGQIDSLNVSNAVSIACYEVERQRIENSYKM